MNKALLCNLLSNIESLQAIPKYSRTVRQTEAIHRMQVQVGQSWLARKNNLPKWWSLLAKSSPKFKKQVEACVAVTQKNKGAKKTSSPPKPTKQPRIDVGLERPMTSDQFLRHLEDEMDLPYGTLDVCMGAD